MSTAVCILGMHRSGTSCLAGCLESAGLQLGEVVEWAPFNLKGNRENLDIRALNDDVLATSGGAWDAPPAQLRWTPAQEARRDAIVEGLSALGDLWGFKDPRVVLTLPFWQERVGKLRVAATFRHPLAVAQSLAARQDVPLERGIWLWREYNERLLRYVRQSEAALVSFDAPREEYLGALRATVAYLGLDQPAGIEARLDSFFEESLRRQSRTTGSAATLSAEVGSLYDALDGHYRSWLQYA